MIKQIGQTFRRSDYSTYRYANASVDMKDGFDATTGNMIVEINSKILFDNFQRMYIKDKNTVKRWSIQGFYFYNLTKITKLIMNGELEFKDGNIKGYGVFKKKGWEETIDFYSTKEELETSLGRTKYEIDRSFKEIFNKVNKNDI